MAEVIFAEQTLMFAVDGGMAVLELTPAPFTLIDGETYRVVLDGVEHELICFSQDGIICLMHSTGTDEYGDATDGSFFIMYASEELSDATGGIVAVEIVGGVETHTLAIYKGAEEVVLYSIKSTTLKAIGNAIRRKTGGNAPLDPETEMPGAIDSITGGGGGSSADVRYVTFTNPATGETFVKPVAVGDDCVDVVAKGLWAKPTQESTAQYDYAFANSWSAEPNGTADANILKSITEDKTVYAVFTATVRTYTVTLYDSDGTTILKTEQVAYGSRPSYKPTKTGYTFAGWTPTTAVTGDTSYVAVWIEGIGGTLNDGAITWRIAENVLSFTGTGEIPTQPRKTTSSYKVVSDAPWAAYASSFSSVVIGEGITKVGGYAFYRLTNITSVSLPSSLAGDAFGANCFEGTYITEITIPQTVTTIGNSAFYECTKLTAVTIHKNITRICWGAFYGAGLTSATFEVTSGWWYASNATDTSGTTLYNLHNKSTAATYLKSTYNSYYWNRT